MLGGAAGLASGFSQGLKTGTTMFNNLAYQRRLKQQQDRLDKTAALQQKNSERDALLDVIEVSTKLFNNSNIPEEMKVEQWNGPYSEAMKKATGKNVPNMARWSPDFGKVTTRANEIAHDKKLTRVEKRQALEYISTKVRNSQKLKDSIGDSLTEMEAREDAAIEKYAQMIVKHASLRPGWQEDATKEEKLEFNEFNEFMRRNPGSGQMVLAKAEEIKRENEEKQPKITGRGTAIGAWIREQVEEKGKDLGETVQLADKLFPKESDWKVMFRMLRPDLFPDDPGNTGDTGDTDDPLGIGSKLID